MTSTNENPFPGLNLSDEDQLKVWALIREQINVVEQMRNTVLALALIVVSAFCIKTFTQIAPDPGSDVQAAFSVFMKWMTWIVAGMAVLSLAMRQVMLHKLHRLAMSLPIAQDKLEYISNQTHWALVRVMFGEYGYRFIYWLIVRVGAK